MVIICNDVYEIFKSLKVYPYGSNITYPNVFLRDQCGLLLVYHSTL